MKDINLRVNSLFGIGLSLFMGYQSGYANSSDNPNIILIMADDLGYGDLGCYGQEKIKTPNIDKLASEGMIFTQAYAGSTVCAPSRSSLMTGMHNGHNRLRDNIPHGTFLQPDDFTIAELLKKAGYVTGGIGKWSLGNPGSWGVPVNQGFDYYYGHLNQDQAHFYYPDYLWENDQVVLLSGNRGEQKDEYTQNLFTEKALDFIEKNKQNPFFLYLPYTIPHFSDYPENTPEYYIVPSDEPYKDNQWTQTQKNYAAMITMLDEDVGEIMSLIKESGIYENTIVVFTSDNGPLKRVSEVYEFFNSSGPLKGGKRDNYEGGIRVPFIVRWPGVVKESVISDEVIAFWDIMPTLAEIIDYPAEIETDGISFLPTLLGENKVKHEYLYWDYGHVRNTFIQAVRWGKYKGIRTISETDVVFELYDLENDPGENNDISKEYAGIIQTIIEFMEEAYTYDDAYPRRISNLSHETIENNHNEGLNEMTSVSGSDPYGYPEDINASLDFARIDSSDTYTDTVESEGAFKKYRLIAHRGGITGGQHGNYNEFDPAAIQKAIDVGYYMIEMDVNMTKDSVLIVHHDKDFTRFFNDDRRVDEILWEDVTKLKSDKGDYHPVSFEEAAKMCSGKVKLMIDTKAPRSPGFLKRLGNIMEKYDLLDGAYFLGSDVEMFMDRAKMSINMGQVPRLMEMLENNEDVARHYFLFSSANKLTSSVIKLAQKNGITVVAALNTHNYTDENHWLGAKRDIEFMKECGVVEFQIDSHYDKWLLN